MHGSARTLSGDCQYIDYRVIAEPCNPNRDLVSAFPASATAAAAVATATTTAAASAAAALFARASFVDRQRPAIVLSAVDAGNGRLGFLIAIHLDETKAFAPAGVAIVDDLGAFHRPKFTKHLFEV
jgi:hypothetical protein